MKTLLRSVFIADALSDNKDLFLYNFHALADSGLSFETAEDTTIWEWVSSFVQAHGHVPSLSTLRSHFEASGDILERLERLVTLRPLVRGDFLAYLEDRANERRCRETLALAKEVSAIVNTGIEIKQRNQSVKLKGPMDAIRYFMDKSHDLVQPTVGHRLSGNLLNDGVDFLKRYDAVKADPRYGLGQFTGIAQIDQYLKGARKGELWIHAAFTGHLKTFFATHWAYIQAVYFGYSSLYFSLEVPYLQIRNIIYTMHSAHEDFAEVRRRLGISRLGLEYSKIRDGQLAPNEEVFLKDYVVPDFNRSPTVPHNGPHSLDPASYGDILIEVADPEKMDFTVVDLRHKAELLYAKTPFNMIFVDHVGLVSSRGRFASMTDRLNEVLRDLKKISGSFHRGAGIAVVGLTQISRDGFRNALKNEGRYNLTNLAVANETERSADIVTASWVDDELKALGRAMFQCLKSRDHEPFPRIPVRVEYAHRRLLTDLTPVEEIQAHLAAMRGEEPDGGDFPKRRKNKPVPPIVPQSDLFSIDSLDT